MPTLIDQHGKPIIGKAKTATYEPTDHRWYRRPRDLPMFTFLTIHAMLLDPTVRLGLAMRAAPLYAAEFAFKQGEKWTPGIQADDTNVGAFVLRQMRRIWDNDLEALLRSQVWGWAGAEVTLKQTKNGVEVDRLLSRHANDTRVLLRNGEAAGVRFMRIKEAIGGHVDIEWPNAVWNTYNPDEGREYGNSILLGSYSSWADKWLDGGALDVRRLFMHKDAYGGADISYPPGTTNVEGKGEIPNRDIAREMVEQAQSGSVTTRPSTVDPVTKVPLWNIKRAAIPSSPTHILEFPDKLDVEILRGMEIPDDILTAEASGSWAGKQVPMMAFYNGLDCFLRSVIRSIVTQILEPLVVLNYGAGHTFTVTTKPLALQAMEQQAKSEAQSRPPSPFGNNGSGNPFDQPQRESGQLGQNGNGQHNGQANGQPPQRRMGLEFESQHPRDEDGEFAKKENTVNKVVKSFHDSTPTTQARNLDARLSIDPMEAVGEGTLRATELVDAARRVMMIRMAAVHAPKGGITISGKKFVGGEFIPGTVLKQASAEQRREIEGGKQATNKTGPSEKAKRAMGSAKRIAGDVQRYAEEHNEPKFAKAMGGASFRDNEPIDVVVADDEGHIAHGIELKTMVDNGNNKITMKGEAMRRKLDWSRRNKAKIHTIVIDDSLVFNANGPGKHDESKRRFFYRRGVGSFRVGGMHEAKNVKELKALLDMPTNKLPEGAK